MTTVEREIAEEFASAFLPDASALDRYRSELEESGLVEHLETAAADFWDSVRADNERGAGYNTGRVTGSRGYEEGLRLYAIVRELQPSVAVETGICNGVSTAFLLLGLERNGNGCLYSIDLPEIAGADYEPGTFWEGKGGAVIPPGKEVGWMVPPSLRERWEFQLGRSQDLLPGLLGRVEPIDLFLHDSEHTYACMSFEFAHAWPVLREGGALIADDVQLNPAWEELAGRVRRTSIRLGAKMSFLVK